jgi:Tfp pilus assembly protein PilV
MTLLRRTRSRLGDEAGSMLLELVLSLVFLAVAVGALLSVFASSMISLRNAGISGTAQTLVERQMEVYKTLPYPSLRLSAATVPGGSDVYVTSPPATVSTGFANVTAGATTPSSECVSPTQAKGECAKQTFTGPDGRTYRVDSYVIAATPSGGRPGVKITVAVRIMTGSTAGPIKAQTTSAFDPASPPS